MKFTLSVLALLFSFNSFAVVASGNVFYLIPQRNEIVKRDMSLSVPARGEGDVILISSSGSETKATNFWTTEDHGRKVFHVLFAALKNPTDPNSETISMLFEGTYMRGGNLAAYYGDIYFGGTASTVEMAQTLNGFKHVGGFVFKSDIK
jgi:hypothetical protein